MQHSPFLNTKDEIGFIDCQRVIHYVQNGDGAKDKRLWDVAG